MTTRDRFDFPERIPYRSSVRKGVTRVAIVGDPRHAEELLRLTRGFDDIAVGVVCVPGKHPAVARIEHDHRVFCTADVNEVFQAPSIDLVLDLSEDPRVRGVLERQRPQHIALISGAGTDFVLDLLAVEKRAREQERTFAELQIAYERIKEHERVLHASRDSLERANDELESRLAEIFFTHEFFKALTSYTTVSDVCSLIVDGCNGIIGAEISCVYLLDRSDWTLRLVASQGWGVSAFHERIPVEKTVLGKAFAGATVQNENATVEDAAWATDPASVASQAVVPLRAGEEVFGVLLAASCEHRLMSEEELERMLVLGNQSSLALQNALLHGELERLSKTDRLTELFNQYHFRTRLEQEHRRSSRTGREYSVVMVDIDDFKRFNDAHGHLEGDEVLRRVARELRSVISESDTAARYGGEEFVLLLPGTGAEGALRLAEEVRAHIEALAVPGGEPEEAAGRTVSVGVATSAGANGTALDVLERADAAMYSAKRAGKNRVVASEG